ncbi:MAG: MerR family transcriptional regulator [Bryobacteraceae bacterium]
MKPARPAPNTGAGPGDGPFIPDKLYFRIGEAAQLVGVEPYVLRFWETEFPQLNPKKSGTGHRLYRRKEVELLLEVKRLLYEKKFTIEGARLYFEQNRKKGGAKVTPVKPASAAPPPAPSQGGLFGEAAPSRRVPDEIRAEVAAILQIFG